MTIDQILKEALDKLRSIEPVNNEEFRELAMLEDVLSKLLKLMVYPYRIPQDTR